MTRQQKNLLKLLAFANFLLLCCGLPVFAIVMDAGGIQARLVAMAPRPPATATPRATVTPTRVIPTATLQAGWKLHAVSKDGFAMANPRDSRVAAQ